MPKSFDATLKELIQAYPHDWLALLGMPAAGPVQILDTDLSTVTAAADSIVYLLETPDWILNLELQSGRSPTLPSRILLYHALIHARYLLPVHSAVLLLRREADTPAITSRLFHAPRPAGRLDFEYEVERVWNWPVERVLAGGVGTLPLAPLCAVARNELPEVVHAMEERLKMTKPQEEADLWTATYVLMGLCYPRELATELMWRITKMRDSTTYQAILEEGREEGREVGIELGRERLREALLKLGGRRLGEPGPEIRSAVAAIKDIDDLERRIERVLDVESWSELLGPQ